MKTQNRIIIFLTSVFFAYILIFSGVIYYSISSYAYTDFYKRLEIRAITMAKIQLENNQDIDVVKEIRQDFLEKLPDEKITLIDLDEIADSEVLLNKANIPQEFIQQIIEEERVFYKQNNTFYSGIKYENYIVVVSAQNYYAEHHMVHLRNLLFFSLLISVLIIVFIAYFFSRTVMQPISKIIKGVKKIGTESLNYRLEESQSNEEMKSLATTFNDMLNRLETSFETQKNFISNASHELNTPLTSIIGEAEVTLSKDRSSEEYKQSLITILEEAEKLNKKTKALLFLAQTGYNKGKINQDSIIRMDELVIDVKTTVEKIYPEANIYLDFNLLPENPYHLKVKGNEQLLHLAVSNIVMNACKYSDNAKVDIILAASDVNVILIIKDLGVGIPEKELGYIYDPFFRASNTEDYSGYGIGLPLSRNVIKLHRGELIVSSKENEGTTVEILLPHK